MSADDPEADLFTLSWDNLPNFEPGKRYVDRTGWEPGPWDTEPDSFVFEYKGFRGVLLRHHEWGSWNGYVGVPEGHPFYGAEPERVPLNVAWSGVLGDLLYSRALADVPGPQWWFFGFDCNHAWDIAPGYEAGLERTLASVPAEVRAAEPAIERVLGRLRSRTSAALRFPGSQYRTLTAVRERIQHMIDTQLIEATSDDLRPPEEPETIH